MNEVQVKIVCPECDGTQTRMYTDRGIGDMDCDTCQGHGSIFKWIPISEFMAEWKKIAKGKS